MAALVVLWIICGGVSAMIANHKGRDAFPWFLIGVIFGPLGILASIVVSSTDAKKEKQAIIQGSMKQCPRCAEAVKSAAVVCKHCGANLEAEASQNQLSSDAKSRHQALQDAIAKNDLETARAILNSGLDLGDNPLPLSHLDYAEMHGNAEMRDLLASKLENA
ncbi:MAG: hypothetical protein R3175_07410 [Marinobacter sp.]|uniref:zinc ribbon domain-containing protein n=1 Tax=Marinobacter sp. TaxID=50741 RepID=UPI00299D344F|nr:hypothetical protein [Marinobacter sp.]MDX1755867.1 hypothetical protein [Marinobacter sp.]